jgi:uncharacterized protein
MSAKGAGGRPAMPSRPSLAGTRPRVIRVKVKPSAKQSALLEGADGIWQARLRSPPVDGKANAELIALVAAHFGCRRAAVVIKAGAGDRMKLLQILA